jgi:enoyl-CoA hydratase/carnithine racemase
MTHASIRLGEGAQNLVTGRGIAALRSQVAAAVAAGRPIVFEPATEGSFFCGGFDLADLAAGGEAAARQAFADFLELGRAVFLAPVPVGARAQGHAIGIGAMLVLAADRAVMAPRAKLRFPELLLGLGLFADNVAMIRHRGTGALAERLLLRAEALEAAECLRLGLVAEIAEESVTAEAVLAGIPPSAGHAAPDPAAFARLKLLCRAGLLVEPVAAQLDAFMESWRAARARGAF